MSFLAQTVRYIGKELHDSEVASYYITASFLRYHIIYYVHSSALRSLINISLVADILVYSSIFQLLSCNVD